MRLRARLRLLAELVPPAGAVADIGSGHGAVAVALASAGRRVIATEVRPSRVAALRDAVGRAGVEVETRLGTGLQPLRRGEVAVAVIAGLGGRSILRILEASDWLPATLILQPAQDAAMVRDWLALRGWPAREEAVVQRGRVHATFVVEPAAA